MKPIAERTSKRMAHSLYLLSMLLLGLTGFAQMPIFKRYYIADIPGLGWLAQFYVTHYMHYLGGGLLLALAAFFLLDYFAGADRSRRLTASGYARAMMVGALIVSGIFLVARNLPGVHLGHRLIIFLDLFHLGTVMALILTSLYCLIRRKSWFSEP